MIDWRWAEVDRLENQENWKEAKSLLVKKWKQDPHDVKTTIRLGFFCWYVLVEGGPLEIHEIDCDEVETILGQVTSFGMATHDAHPDFLWCFGYMMSLFPYYFGEDTYFEEKGISMLKRAYDMCPDDPVYTYSYLGSFPSAEEELKKAFQKVQVVLNDRFQGNGFLSEYFKNVWNG